jgi:hypothetical protein
LGKVGKITKANPKMKNANPTIENVRAGPLISGGSADLKASPDTVSKIPEMSSAICGFA